ncbi:MAG: hypothetical protein NC078_02195, partial [Ruminococcus sp.]|nr:hypothetical protein [Ruminococcus sp.]
MDKKEVPVIYFSVAGSNSFHKIELSKSLLRFAEFDFTYFWEQCIEAGRNARKTGRLSANLEAIALGSAAKCHPYVEACIGTEFDGLVTDCIIAYICHSEGIGPEELWGRCISPKSLYEKAIFERISEYKTGRAINQWINIVRMQEYARSKMRFIYETESNIMLSPGDYRARREYFDLAFAVAANETGCDMRKMPSVKKYSPSSLPDCVFMMGRVSKAIYKRLSEVLADAPLSRDKNLNDHNRDSAALDAFSYVKDMPRPESIDMNLAMENITALPEVVYVPDSFKAVIDLEFTCMYEEGVYLAKCPRCGRFFRRDLEEKSPYCGRINSSGMTCAEQVEEELGIASMKYPRGNDNADTDGNVSEIYGGDIEERAAAAVSEESERERDHECKETEKTLNELSMSAGGGEESGEDGEADESADRGKPREMPRETEKRCQKVYNLLYKRIGRIMSEEEFREWSKFLSDLKRDYRSGDAELPQIEDFLVYWETAVKKISRRSGKSRSEKAEQFSEVLRREDITVDADDEDKLTRIDPAVRNVLQSAAFYGSVTDEEELPAVKKPRGQDISEDNGDGQLEFENLSGMFDEVVSAAEEKAGT